MHYTYMLTYVTRAKGANMVRYSLVWAILYGSPLTTREIEGVTSNGSSICKFASISSTLVANGKK